MQINDTGTTRNTRASAIADMRADATKIASDLRTRADEITRSANIIAGIALDDNRSESLDGPTWDSAAKILASAGVAVPSSAIYCWSK